MTARGPVSQHLVGSSYLCLPADSIPLSGAQR